MAHNILKNTRIGNYYTFTQAFRVFNVRYLYGTARSCVVNVQTCLNNLIRRFFLSHFSSKKCLKCVNVKHANKKYYLEHMGIKYGHRKNINSVTYK